MIDFIVGLPVLIFLMWLYGTWPAGPRCCSRRPSSFLALVTALGAGFLLSALNVRYRDVRYMIPVFLQVLPLSPGSCTRSRRSRRSGSGSSRSTR